MVQFVERLLHGPGAVLLATFCATSATAGERHRAHTAERAARHPLRAANHESIGLGSGAAIRQFRIYYRVATVANLNQADGLHPTRAGVERVVAGILPSVEDFLKRLRKGP